MQLRTVFLVLGVVGLGFYIQKNKGDETLSTAARSGATPPAAARQAQNHLTAADTAYITSYMQNVAANYRAYREGSTSQTFVLPSGRMMTATITKTPSGYCPVRRETLHTISVSTSMD